LEAPERSFWTCVLGGFSDLLLWLIEAIPWSIIACDDDAEGGMIYMVMPAQGWVAKTLSLPCISPYEKPPTVYETRYTSVSQEIIKTSSFFYYDRGSSYRNSLGCLVQLRFGGKASD